MVPARNVASGSFGKLRFVRQAQRFVDFRYGSSSPAK